MWQALMWVILGCMIGSEWRDFKGERFWKRIRLTIGETLGNLTFLLIVVMLVAGIALVVYLLYQFIVWLVCLFPLPARWCLLLIPTGAIWGFFACKAQNFGERLRNTGGFALVGLVAWLLCLFFIWWLTIESQAPIPRS